MSGHSKWHSIKHQKMAEDAKRGKVFTKHAKLIAIAARGGGDPEMNPSLRMAIENGRAENMPRENIERAIKKGTGESKDGAQMEEVYYEGFAPGGVALYVETLTDNKNRTFTNLRFVFGKNEGTLGAAGSVGYLFKKVGQIVLDAAGKNVDEMELNAIDAGAEDVVHGEDEVKVYTAPTALMTVRSKLAEVGFPSKSAAMTHLPQTIVEITDLEIAKSLLNLIQKIEEDEDVTEVFANFTIAKEIEEMLGEE